MAFLVLSSGKRADRAVNHAGGSSELRRVRRRPGRSVLHVDDSPCAKLALAKQMLDVAMLKEMLLTRSASGT